MLEQYQHPITYKPSGSAAADYRYAMEEYEASMRSYLPTAREAVILDVGCGWGQFLYWLKTLGYGNTVLVQRDLEERPV